MFKKFVLIAMAAVAAGCSGNKDLCANKSCDSPLICDADDGVCKCGGRGGVACPTGFVCDSAANTCQSTRCKGVDCSMSPGTSCDVVDATCKCGGTGGTVCGGTDVCNPASKRCEPPVSCSEVACSRNQTCDQATGQCKCGATACAAGQFCAVDMAGAKSCVGDICTGVKCAGTTKCDPADGYCKCNSVICQSGAACSCPSGSDGGSCADTDRTCRAGSACQGVTCAGGTTCDPVDGACKCGGPGGPACAANQICALGPPAQCQGGSQCTQPDGGAKTCGGGTSCDPEDGRCKCGGRGGTLCAPAVDGGVPAEICVSTPGQLVCRPPCDTRAPNCSVGTACYFDSAAATPAAYCAAHVEPSAKLNDGCTAANQCFTEADGGLPGPLHCNGLAAGTTGICRSYCDTTQANNCPTQVAQNCVQIQTAPAGVGYCQPN